MTIYLENDSLNVVLPSAVLALGNDCCKMFLYLDRNSPMTAARFDLGPYRLFRPDHDSQFISESGRVWRPVG